MAFIQRWWTGVCYGEQICPIRALPLSGGDVERHRHTCRPTAKLPGRFHPRTVLGDVHNARIVRTEQLREFARYSQKDFPKPARIAGTAPGRSTDLINT